MKRTLKISTEEEDKKDRKKRKEKKEGKDTYVVTCSRTSSYHQGIQWNAWIPPPLTKDVEFGLWEWRNRCESGLVGPLSTDYQMV